jgi:hypothetical protein
MQKTISICYTYGTEPYMIAIAYEIEKEENISLIVCTVQPLVDIQPPQWLRTRKFGIKTMFHEGAYSLLYNDGNHHADLDTTLFIDKACSAIMQQEKMQLAS